MQQQTNEDTLNKLISSFGPLLTGQDLYSAIGYKTYSAFHRGQLCGEIGVHVFKIPGRKGWFALTVDVAKWLEVQSVK